MSLKKYFSVKLLYIMNILVEKKKEFTIRIINILSPLIFEGLSSIYNKAKEMSTGDNVLKLFQSFLKRIPKWNEDLLGAEVNRIKTGSKDFNFLYDLIRACVKSNLYILAFSPYQQNPPKINPEHYNRIDFDKFIHNIYIECAREIWNNPYLFYHNYTGIEIKRNQRDTLDLIKHCIEESIRKALPLKHLLELYLGDEFLENIPDDNFEKTITEVEMQNLKSLLKKDLSEEKKNTDVAHTHNEKKSSEANSNFLAREPTVSQRSPTLSKINESKNSDSDKTNATDGTNATNATNATNKTNTQILSLSLDKKSENNGSKEMKGGNDNSNSTGDINNKILNILNNKDLDLSDDNATSDKNVKTRKLSETSSENLVESNNEYNNMDSNLKKILKNDLGESDTESSFNFKPETQSKAYQEIFSNSINDSTNTQQKNDELNKNKFFNNYLRF